MLNERILTVFELNNYSKSILENDLILNGIYVSGEISNFKQHSSGHMYFTLKDSLASITSVMFKTQRMKLKFIPENGLKVIVFGRASIYEKTGQFQFYAETMEPSGLGGLYLAFEKLKESLAAEGLFNEENKLPIPKSPKNIAIITSETGAAVRDVISVSKRRNKNIGLLVVPTLVQGENAPGSIVESIKIVNLLKDIDLIILARGGGSIEELWAFNEEIVARAIHKSKIPIISAIGHETDFTISDFVSDLRAPTPSAAAELSVPLLEDMVSDIINLSYQLQEVMYNKIDTNKKILSDLLKNMKTPKESVYNKQIYIEDLFIRLNKVTINLIKEKKLLFQNKADLLNSVSPLKVMSRGFSIVTKDDKVLESVRELNKNDKIKIILKDGNATAEVLSIEKED